MYLAYTKQYIPAIAKKIRFTISPLSNKFQGWSEVITQSGLENIFWKAY